MRAQPPLHLSTRGPAASPDTRLGFIPKLLATALLALTACADETVAIGTSDAGTSDAGTSDTGAPDAGVPTCDPSRQAITIPGSRAHALDMSPDGERLLLSEGAGVTVRDVRTGALLRELAGDDAAFAYDGQVLVRGPDALLRVDGATTALTTSPVCQWSMSPDRRFALAGFDCVEPEMGGPTIGTLMVFGVADGSVFLAPQVMLGWVAVTGRDSSRPRVAFLASPAPAACACSPWDASLFELELGGSGGAAQLGRYREILGYTPVTERLIAGDQACSCPFQDGSTWRDVYADRTIADRVVMAPTVDVPMDQRDVWGSGVPPRHLGATGMLTVGRDDFRLHYAPYLSSSTAGALADPASRTDAVLLSDGPVDVAALTIDASGHLVRVALTSPGNVEVVTGPDVVVSRLLLSADRRQVAALADGGITVEIGELWLGGAVGPFQRVGTWAAGAYAAGFIPGDRGFLVREVDSRLLRRWRDGAWADVDSEATPGTSVLTDARGCVLVHQGADGLRVVPIP